MPTGLGAARRRSVVARAASRSCEPDELVRTMKLLGRCGSVADAQRAPTSILPPPRAKARTVDSRWAEKIYDPSYGTSTKQNGWPQSVQMYSAKPHRRARNRMRWARKKQRRGWRRRLARRVPGFKKLWPQWHAYSPKPAARGDRARRGARAARTGSGPSCRSAHDRRRDPPAPDRRADARSARTRYLWTPSRSTRRT